VQQVDEARGPRRRVGVAEDGRRDRLAQPDGLVRRRRLFEHRHEPWHVVLAREAAEGGESGLAHRRILVGREAVHRLDRVVRALLGQHLDEGGLRRHRRRVEKREGLRDDDGGWTADECRLQGGALGGARLRKQRDELGQHLGLPQARRRVDRRHPHRLVGAAEALARERQRGRVAAAAEHRNDRGAHLRLRCGGLLDPARGGRGPGDGFGEIQGRAAHARRRVVDRRDEIAERRLALDRPDERERGAGVLRLVRPHVPGEHGAGDPERLLRMAGLGQPAREQRVERRRLRALARRGVEPHAREHLGRGRVADVGERGERGVADGAIARSGERKELRYRLAAAAAAKSVDQDRLDGGRRTAERAEENASDAGRVDREERGRRRPGQALVHEVLLERQDGLPSSHELQLRDEEPGHVLVGHAPEGGDERLGHGGAIRLGVRPRGVHGETVHGKARLRVVALSRRLHQSEHGSETPWA
jgi:hypothetical protein